MSYCKFICPTYLRWFVQILYTLRTQLHNCFFSSEIYAGIYQQVAIATHTHVLYLQSKMGVCGNVIGWEYSFYWKRVFCMLKYIAHLIFIFMLIVYQGQSIVLFNVPVEGFSKLEVLKKLTAENCQFWKGSLRFG